MEKLKITRAEAIDAVFECLPADRLQFVSDDIVENSRWSILHDVVIRDSVNGKFYRDTYSVGATENQDESPWEHDDPDFTRVYPHEITTTVYKAEESEA
jgi:hypothetical protein